MLCYVDADGGNYGVAEDNLMIIDLDSRESDFLADLHDDERIAVFKIMKENSDDPEFDLWGAHAAYISQEYGEDACSNECLCSPKMKHDSEACDPDDCIFDH